MRRFLSQTLLVAGSLAVACLLVEAGLRLLGVEYPRFYVYDKRLGSALRPGAQGWFRSEGRSWISVNAAGMRDREHDIPKPPGAFRIAVLGDSMTEAMQVPREQNFCSILEHRLRDCAAMADKKPEVLNFGVSGYGTAQELILLSERVWRYQPDLVLLAMFPGNDIRNNNSVLNGELYAPYYSYENGKLALRHPPPIQTGALRALRDTLLDHSRTIQLIYHVRKALRTRGADQMVARDQDPAITGEQGVDNATFGEPHQEMWHDAWRLTENLLLKMRDDVHAHGARFAVALIPSGIQTHPDAGLRKAFIARHGIESLSYAHDRLVSFARQHEMDVIPLEAPLRNYAEVHRSMTHGFANSVPGFGHMNETGHRIAGELLAARICAQQ
jgi:hypothetical protein